jgi:glycogen debranching enzyme
MSSQKGGSMRRSGGQTASVLSLAGQVARNPDRNAALEWLLTNGRGDWACGTVGGVNTRREHGLFCAEAGDGGRMTLWATVDVALEREGRRLELASHQFAATRHPEGYRLCAGFKVDPVPEWRYEAEGLLLTRRVVMPRGRRFVVDCWALDAAAATGWSLKLRPLFAYRDAESLTSANLDCNMALRGGEGFFAMTPYAGCPEFMARYPGGRMRFDPVWYFKFRHALDVAAGRPADEDFFTPCEIAFDLKPGATVFLAGGCEDPGEEAGGAVAREIERRRGLSLPGLERDGISAALAWGAECFLDEDAARGPRLAAKRLGGEAAAGEREMLIALPGLLLHTRRTGEARACLCGALARLAQGGGEGDEALWFMRAAEQYIDHSRDWEFLRGELAPGCDALAQRLIEGVGGYRMAADGLLCGGGDRPLTWMNAVAEGRAVTPRAGKPVEVNALWHHALGLLARWAGRRNLTEAAQRYATLQELCGRSFRQRFWNEAERCLYDVVDTPSGALDAAVRPNQLWAVALPTDLLDRAQAAGALGAVERRLLTPAGLRTLPVEDKAFVPSGEGRDLARAAHQGAVHPWLMGVYVDALFRVHGRTSRGYARAETALEALLSTHLREGCVGQVTERFDGAAPHAARGAAAHAAGLGELARAYVETKAERW